MKTRYLLLAFASLLFLTGAFMNYRGIQAEIEDDTWWGEWYNLKRDYQTLVHPWYEPEILPQVEDRMGRPYCINPWYYADNDEHLHFCWSRLVVLIIWYAYIFIGPWILLWLIYKHPQNAGKQNTDTEQSGFFCYLEASGWTSKRLPGYGYIFRREDETIVAGNGGYYLNGRKISKADLYKHIDYQPESMAAQP